MSCSRTLSLNWASCGTSIFGDVDGVVGLFCAVAALVGSGVWGGDCPVDGLVVFGVGVGGMVGVSSPAMGWGLVGMATRGLGVLAGSSTTVLVVAALLDGGRVASSFTEVWVFWFADACGSALFEHAIMSVVSRMSSRGSSAVFM